MKRIVTLAAFALLLTTQVFATYVVVLRDGTRYKAKAKWTVTNGKALIRLENGQTMQIDPKEIDAVKSEEVNNLGLGDVKVLGVGQEPSGQSGPPKTPSLDSAVRRRQAQPLPVTPQTGTAATATPTVAPVKDELNGRLKDNFERAYENLGIFERKLSGTNSAVRAELTVDSEDKVFNVLSATAFLVVRNALIDTIRIDSVDLFMKTTTGGSSGRFQITRADAEAIHSKTIAIPDYFVRKVIY
ncbi:MAG: hypothetical protein JJE51_01225 [Thermoanaerobaculia bacterium]|nr:hypothetical protein [Thermoanaerobaculia bacterium]